MSSAAPIATIIKLYAQITVCTSETMLCKYWRLNFPLKTILTVCHSLRRYVNLAIMSMNVNQVML